MDSVNVPCWLGAAVLAVASLSACGGKQAASDSPSGKTPGAGGSFAGADSGTTSSSFGVSITPAASVLCAGHCVVLSAQATGGTPPYSYDWDHGLPAGAGPLTVCPDMTTTYTVTAIDSSNRGGEFATTSDQRSASVTVGITSACTDGGEPLVDASVAAGPAPTLGHVLCRTTWPTGGDTGNAPYGFGGRTTQGNVTTDPEGNILVVYSHTGTATVGGNSFSAGNDTDALVVKLDSSCKVLWAREFGGFLANVLPDSIATDSASNVLVGGALSGAVDFGTGTVNGASPNAALVLKLDPNGKTLWVKTFPSTATQGSSVFDLTVDPSANVLLIAAGGPDTNFGGGAAGGSATSGTFLVKLGSDGHQVFAKPPSLFGKDAAASLLRVATNRTGAIWVTGTNADPTGMMTTTPVTALDSSGAVVAYTRVIQGPPGVGYWNGASLKVDDAGNAAVFTSWGGVSADAGIEAGYQGDVRVLSELSPMGVPLWTSTANFLSQYDFSWEGSHYLGMAAGGDVFVGSGFTGKIDLGNPLGTLTSAANESLDVTVLDPVAGNLRAAAEWGDGNDDYPSDLTVDAQGDAIFVGAEYVSSALAFFVLKIGW